MSGNCKRQNIWFPTLKLTRENMAQRNQYHSFFYNLLNHFLFLKNKFAFFESAVVSWRYLMSMNLNQAHFRLFVAVIILQKILRTKSVLPHTYNFQTAHSTLACLNSKLKVHFWVIFKNLSCKNKSNLTRFLNSGLFGNTVLRSKVVDVAPNPHLNQVKRDPMHLCGCSWWRARSFHHVLRATGLTRERARFAFLWRAGTELDMRRQVWADPNVVSPPLLLSFEKTVVVLKTDQVRNYFDFLCETEKKEHVLQD